MKNEIKNFVKKNEILFKCIGYMEEKIQEAISKKKWKSLQNLSKIYIELGSGPKKGSNGWITVDVSGADILWDLRKGIPLKSGTVDKIYSSHMLEHIPYNQLIPFLHECSRVLRENGEFFVCVPDAKEYIQAYVSNQFFRGRETWWTPALVDTGSCIDQINYIAYMGGEHKHMFDQESLINILFKAGFGRAKIRNFDRLLDLEERRVGSIYAIAYKSPSEN